MCERAKLEQFLICDSQLLSNKQASVPKTAEVNSGSHTKVPKYTAVSYM